MDAYVHTDAHAKTYTSLSLPVSFTENISPRVCVYIVCRAEPPDRKPNIEHIWICISTLSACFVWNCWRIVQVRDSKSFTACIVPRWGISQGYHAILGRREHVVLEGPFARGSLLSSPITSDFKQTNLKMLQGIGGQRAKPSNCLVKCIWRSQDLKTNKHLEHTWSLLSSCLWLSVVDVLFGQDGLSAIFGRSSADGAKRLRCGGFNHAMVRANFEREQPKVWRKILKNVFTAAYVLIGI